MWVFLGRGEHVLGVTSARLTVCASSDRSQYHKHTRLLADRMCRKPDNNNKNVVMGLASCRGMIGSGPEGGQTIAERIFADRRLGAFFFCSRDFEDRRDFRYIFPTLAFQLSHKYPDFRSTLNPLLQSNPDIVHESLYNQVEALIVGPSVRRRSRRSSSSAR